MGEDQGGGASRSTDPATGTSAATDVSLREYLTQRIDAVERRSEARFLAMETAVELAMEANERRFDGVNEFRATLSDQATQFVTRDTMNAQIEKIEASIFRNRDAILDMGKRLDRREGQDAGSRITKGSLYAAVGAAIALLGFLVVLANYISGH